ncbi:MAG: type I-U CRISPR-associated RAMP protein Csb1/Cas7u [Candidatus Brachytrichaceae bacterium NZ_4S206]|jgi:CRISPR-associated protein Csb1
MTTLDFSPLKNEPRLLMQAGLKPLQGERFQPTGFPDLGAALYTLADGTQMLLVESAQSVANRMELASCKDDKRTLLDCLNGLPYVQSTYNGEVLTTSYLEAHRLSSPYLLSKDWAAKLASEMKLRDDFPLNEPSITTTIFKYDPACLLHGVWLSLKEYKNYFSGGRIRLVRSLSGFIEAQNVRPAENGGVKFDKNAARMTESGNAETGYGTIPFHRTEFVAEDITAYFNLDLALLRGYGLPEEALNLLIALALFKVQGFLARGLRLRTACDLEVKTPLQVTRPAGYTPPTLAELEAALPGLIAACAQRGLFASPTVTTVTYKPKQDAKGKKRKEEEEGEEEAE